MSENSTSAGEKHRRKKIGGSLQRANGVWVMPLKFFQSSFDI